MTRPPVVFFTAARGFASPEPPVLEQVAGEVDDALRTALDAGLTALRDALHQPDAWELVPTKGNAG